MFGFKEYLRRNIVSIGGTKSIKKQVNLEWWSQKVNVGDYLAKVIFEYMMDRNGIKNDVKMKKTIHLMTVGSLIGMYDFDAVVWGSGVHCMENVRRIYKQSKYRKYDVRLVRGPITQEFLKSAGYSVPELYGDPAVIMPDIYTPRCEKEYNTSVILHLSQKGLLETDQDVHFIDVATNNYQAFIDQIVKSKKVISSSLHGIILAESYGVPAVFLSQGMSGELMKFYDWYFSTGRRTIKVAESFDEAIQMTPMELPDLCILRDNVYKTFPIDLWK